MGPSKHRVTFVPAVRTLDDPDTKLVITLGELMDMVSLPHLEDRDSIATDVLQRAKEERGK